jgi:hypothetical protein
MDRLDHQLIQEVVSVEGHAAGGVGDGIHRQMSNFLNARCDWGRSPHSAWVQRIYRNLRVRQQVVGLVEVGFEVRAEATGANPGGCWVRPY